MIRATSASVSRSRTFPPCGRPAFKPTGVSWTFGNFLMIVRLARTPSSRMTYDLRRLHLHGIIERIRRNHRYQLTPPVVRIAMFFSRSYARLRRPKLAEIMPAQVPPLASPLRIALRPPHRADRHMLSEGAIGCLNLTQSNYNPLDKDSSWFFCRLSVMSRAASSPLPYPSLRRTVWPLIRCRTSTPAAEFCRPVRMDRSTLSPDSGTNGRPPYARFVRQRVTLIWFRHIGLHLSSTLPSRRRPCASLRLHVHQVVKGTLTPELWNMLGTRQKGPPAWKRRPDADGQAFGTSGGGEYTGARHRPKPAGSS